MSLLEEALGVWRGPALAEFAAEGFAREEIARLEEERIRAVELKAEAELALGRHAELVGELRALVAANPLRERLRGHLMLALYRSGRQGEALRVFQEGRGVLADELGVDPGPALAALHQRILLQDATLLPVPPLGVPGPRELALGEIARSDAVELFVDRATAVQGAFALDASTAPAVSQICRQHALRPFR